MRLDFNNIDLICDLVILLEKHGVLEEKHTRNFKIKKRYADLVKSGLRAGPARDIVGEEFFITEKAVQAILYGRYSNSKRMDVPLTLKLFETNGNGG